MKRFWRHYGLTCVIAVLFFGTYAGGQILSGWNVYNDERARDGVERISLGAYLHSAHFAEATTENWESEFLQMFVYVYITSYLFQRGSAESNDPDKAPQKRPITNKSPWPVRRGGVWRMLYGHSLSLALAALFLISFWFHCESSTRLENEERLRHGLRAESVWSHLGGARFWFESFQNWQSEFLAIGSMVVLSIFLREKNSPESKPVEAAHGETGK